MMVEIQYIGEIECYSTEKHKMQKKTKKQWCIFKLNFYFNDLYVVLTTCKLELLDSG